MIRKLILGTAGLGGTPYGRNNRVVTLPDARELVKHALACGMRWFDVAPSYGNAEFVLRNTLHTTPDSVVFTKGYPSSDVDYLRRRAGGATTFVLLHNWKPSWYHRWFNASALTRFDGATTYSQDLPSRLNFRHMYFQCDWNVLNQTNFPRICGTWTAPIARSVFLQGALAGGPVPEQLREAVDRVERCAAAFGLSTRAFALRAALENNDIDHVVIGPTTIAELDECLAIARAPHYGIHHVLPQLHLTNRSLTDPRTFL